MARIKQEFMVRNKENLPSYYLGNKIKTKGKFLHILSWKYIIKFLRKYQDKFGCIKKECIPMSAASHPKLDQTDFLNTEGHAQYQHIVGTCQWLIVAGRFDINYAVSSLSRYVAAPRQGHLTMASKVLGYLKKYPKKGYTINLKPLVIDETYTTVKLKQDFGG